MGSQLPAKLESKRKRFIDAVEFLKNKRIKISDKKQKRLIDSPWAIALGPAGSGKTSLLSQSEIHFNLAKKIHITDHHQDPNWWVNKDTIILDIPGRLLNAKKEEKELYLSLIKKHAYKKRCGSILLVVSMNSLLFDSAKHHSQQLKHSIQFIFELEKILKQTIPVYLVINQMDCIDGFSAFFSSLAKEERQQIWGISYPESMKTDLLSFTSSEFDELINRLYFQLINRLHYEPNYLQRFFISLFPQEFASLKPTIKKLIDNFYKAHPNLKLKGIYFSSVGNQEIQLKGNKEQQSIISHRLNAKPYFIHQLVKKIVLLNQHTQKQTRSFIQLHWKPITSIIAIGLVLGLSSVFYIQHKLNLSSTIVSLKTSEETSSQESLANSIKKVSQLMNIQGQFGEEHWWQKWLSTAKHTQVDNVLHEQINQVVKNKLLPDVVNALSSTLTANNTDPVLKIAAFKCYMMMSKPSSLDAVYLAHTLQAILPAQLSSKDMQADLVAIFSNLPTDYFAKLPINYQLVANTQEYLASLSKNQLYYLLFQSNYINLPVLTINLSNNKSANLVFDMKNPNLGIFSLYTPTYWQKIQSQLPQISNQVSQDYAFLTGSAPESQINSEIIWKNYQTNYALAWLAFLKNITIKNTADFSNLVEQLSLLSSSQSVITQLTQLLQQEIPASVISGNPELQQDMQLLTSSTFIQRISSLYQKLNSLNSDQDIFNATKQRILNNGNNDEISALFSLGSQLPAPFNDWCIQLAQQTWNNLLTSTQNYIQDQWQTTVWTSYQAQIFNRFPLNPQASNNVMLKQFINMFANNGLLNQFFNRYLSPFIHTEQTPWEAVSLNGASLAINQTALNAFYQSQQVTKQYFEQDDQLSIPFTLQITQFSQTLRQVAISMGSQQAIFTSNHSNNAAFTWPDANSDQSMLILLTDNEGQTTTITYPDAWGIWQLIQNSRLISQPDAQHLLYEFDDDNLGFRFLIGFQTKNNPFTLDTFAATRFSEKLFHE